MWLIGSVHSGKSCHIQKVHEKWSIFCFYGKFWIVVIFGENCMWSWWFLKFCVLQRKHESNFRFNNPKQFSNWIILVSFYLSHSCKKLLQCSCYEKWKKFIFPQKNSKSLCITTKTWTISNAIFSTTTTIQKMPCKNKQCSIFHEFSEYTIFT